MTKLYKKIVLIAFFLIAGNISYAQYAALNLETGKQNTAIARDASGNIYTTRVQSAGLYEIVKYTNGSGTPTTIYQNITGNVNDLPYGLAIANNGDVYFTAAMSTADEGRIVRLDASNSYTATIVQKGRYFTGLAFDKNGKLYALEFTGSNFGVVRYDNPSSTSSTRTTLYGAITSMQGLTYPTSISVASDLTIYCNNVFNADGGTGYKGGIIKLTTANNGASYTKTDLNTTNYTSALYIDEFNNLYAIESVSQAPYKLYKYAAGMGTGSVFYNSDFHASYPYLAFGVTANNNIIYAIDGDDNQGVGSKLLKLTPADVTPPAVPTNLTATFTGGSKVNLNWTPNAEVDLNGYHIYRVSAGNPTPEMIAVAKGNNTVQITGLNPGTQYSFNITSVDNAFNESAKSSTVNITPQKPLITNASYNANTKVLKVTGTDFLALTGNSNDIAVDKLTLTVEGAITRTLSASNVELTDPTTFSVTLSSADQALLNTLFNKDGTSSTGGTNYNLAVAKGWAAGEDASVNTAQTAIPVSVSAVEVPNITSANYDASTGKLVVTGNGFLSIAGSSNDIIANKFTFTGDGGTAYSLNNTPNVDIINASSFTLTLSATDKTSVNLLLNKNGTSSADNTIYNLAAAEDWDAGADAAVAIADLTGNGITVSNVDPLLPVALTSFTAIKNVREVVLNWITSSEYNSDVYILSKSTNGIDFVEFARVKAAGNSEKTIKYSSIDAKPNIGVTYYKLLQLDKDAKVGLEKIIPVNFQLKADEVLLYPNPVSNELNIKFGDKHFAKAELIDVNGKILKSYQLSSQGEINTINLNNLAKGVYVLKLMGDNNQVIKKIIKN